ncbi:hypothetical protein [Aeromicrobium choanae]|uniref:Uncharacterized protein n=1 Tax=Aeromicrobium choanae TaxID=1736691 RepID=A0A1T4YSB8_9ACTN|nr:hypothetical protein [Aeromicrobium choanae]SKB04563.1 hypothetical protein SAMN06295964_0614 [Aeromicrobium choanae]
MTTTLTHLMPANTTAPTTVPNPGTVHAEATTGEEVTSMSLFEFKSQPRPRADLDRIVVLERIRQRRRAERQASAVYSQVWGIRANR